MRKYLLAATVLAGSAFAASPALADGHLKIVDGDPLELTIQMNHARYPVYREDWPVEQQARASVSYTHLTLPTTSRV